MYKFFTQDGSWVAVPANENFKQAFEQFPDGYIYDYFEHRRIDKDEYNDRFIERNTPLVAACRAKMNEEIEKQQQKDIKMEQRSELGQLLMDKCGLPEAKKNKKDAVGATKAPTSCIPSAGIFAMGAAMQDGGDKYDPFNYRATQVTASVFYNAMMRHLLDWWEGQDFADDSKVHHLGHLMAGAAIVLDGISNENFVDDRPRVKIIAASRKTHVWKQS